MSIEKKIVTREVVVCKCERCGNEWECRDGIPPVSCARCRSYYWNIPRKPRKPRDPNAIPAPAKTRPLTRKPGETRGRKPLPRDPDGNIIRS